MGVTVVEPLPTGLGPEVDSRSTGGRIGRVALNIKNERTHALVRRLAEMTGQSQTSAVEDAVQRRIDELSQSEDEVEARIRRMEEISEAFSAGLTPEDRQALLSADEYLYDDLGLPR